MEEGGEKETISKLTCPKKSGVERRQGKEEEGERGKSREGRKGEIGRLSFKLKEPQEGS